MRKVKIVCTIGPASNSRKVIYGLIKTGMDIARLNFSHGTYEEHRKSVEYIREGARKYNSPVAILQDLKGLKIRIGSIKNGLALIKKNSRLLLTTKDIEGDDKHLSVSYPNIIKDVELGELILIDDGLIRLKVIDKERYGLITEVIEGGLLRENKGVNLPGTKISGEVFTEKDKRDLEFGLKLGIDYVAMSFVRSGADIIKLKEWIRKHNANIPVIAKIESPRAIENIEEIIDASDGLMIARGDLGVEVPIEKVPLIQKDLIEKCNKTMKPVITATQVLESMTEHLTPTRAEVTDVANAVLDGTDALMLSAETAVGKYPLEALKMMHRIINYTETKYPGSLSQLPNSISTSFARAIAEAACISATDIKAKAIVAFSRSGFTSLLVSKFRPTVPIIAFTLEEKIQRRMNLYWGVTPQIMKFPRSTDEMISETEKMLIKKETVKKGDSIVIIATSSFTLGGKTNIMKLHEVGF